MEARMQFVTPEPGARLQCTARHYGRECGAHVIHRAGGWWCPACGKPRSLSETREAISVADAFDAELEVTE